MSVTARQLVGRDEELGAIARLLDDREDLPGALVLSGEAVIGKTTVWLAGIDAAARSPPPSSEPCGWVPARSRPAS